MDAREIIAEELDRYVVSPQIRADGVIAALRASGFTILHDSQNHGPTVERIARKVDGWAKLYDEARPGKAASYREDAAAIRQLKEDRG